MFLLRPRPLPGESLSSWRQRAALENGYRLYPVAPRESRRTDVDLAPGDGVLTWLESMFDIEEAALRTLTLAGLDGKVLTFGQGRAAPRWVLPLRYSARGQQAGMPFCPRCLQVDAQPFFRLRWRLALSSVCEVHDCLLLDKCPNCNCPAWSGSSNLTGLYRHTKAALHECPCCSFDLRNACVVHEVDPSPISLSSILSGTVSLRPEIRVKSYEFTSVFWVICQLLLRSRSQQRIRASSGFLKGIADELATSTAKAPEELPLPMRHRLCSTVARLLQDWPSRFAEFCLEHDLSATHFSADRDSLPAWFHEVIQESLRRQVRGLSTQDIDRAIGALSMRGEPIRKSSVARELGAVDGIALQARLGRRFVATETETQTFLHRIFSYTCEKLPRASSTEIRLRNATLVLQACLSGQSISEVVALSVGQRRKRLDQLLSLITDRPVQRQALETLRSCLQSLEISLKSRNRRGNSSDHDILCAGFRGGPVPVIGIRRMLSICMLGLDRRLSRSVATFSQTLNILDMDHRLTG